MAIATRHSLQAHSTTLQLQSQLSPRCHSLSARFTHGVLRESCSKWPRWERQAAEAAEPMA